MDSFEELIKKLGSHIPKEYDCRACEIEENDEQVKQLPRHTCGKDGRVPDLNEQKKTDANYTVLKNLLMPGNPAQTE